MTVGSVLAGWLPAESVPLGIMYDQRHERLLVAARTGARPRGYIVSDGRVVLDLDGLGELEPADRALATRLATDAPVAGRADVARLVDLARRRRVLAALVDTFAEVRDGADIDATLEALAVAS